MKVSFNLILQLVIELCKLRDIFSSTFGYRLGSLKNQGVNSAVIDKGSGMGVNSAVIDKDSRYR